METSVSYRGGNEKYPTRREENFTNSYLTIADFDKADVNFKSILSTTKFRITLETDW